MKTKKIIIIVASTLIGLLLMGYILLGSFSTKPGMNGFTVTNGMIRLLLSGEDYIKVGEDRYLYRSGSLHKIVEEEYDSYRINDTYHFDTEDLSKLGDSTVQKIVLVEKGGQQLKCKGVHVWEEGLLSGYSAYFVSVEE